MPQKAHFISRLPRSGSTLLSAILPQNPRFHSAMTSPVGGLVERMWEAMSEDNEFSVFITNRLWCSKLPLIRELFPLSKVFCCVRNIPLIIDSIELVIRRNPFDISRLFNNPAEPTTVYSCTETLSQGSRLVGYAYNALKEAFYSEQSTSILLVDYELLTLMPGKTMSLIYQFIGEEPFNYDFDNVQYNKDPEFDKKQKKRVRSNAWSSRF